MTTTSDTQVTPSPRKAVLRTEALARRDALDLDNRLEWDAEIAARTVDASVEDGRRHADTVQPAGNKRAVDRLDPCEVPGCGGLRRVGGQSKARQKAGDPAAHGVSSFRGCRKAGAIRW